MRRLVLLAMVVVGAACSDGGAVDAPPIASATAPSEVAALWLGGVAVSDVAALETHVEPYGLAVLAGVENGLRSDAMAALIESGFGSELAADYWRKFRTDFEAIRGFSIQALTVGEQVPIPNRSDFVGVEITSPESTGLVLLRRSEAVGWQVDLAATVGPALIGPLAEYLVSALDGEHSEVIAEAYRVGILPALDAAISLDPGNSDLEFEAEFIRQLLAG